MIKVNPRRRKALQSFETVVKGFKVDLQRLIGPDRSRYVGNVGPSYFSKVIEILKRRRYNLRRLRVSEQLLNTITQIITQIEIILQTDVVEIKREKAIDKLLRQPSHVDITKVQFVENVINVLNAINNTLNQCNREIEREVPPKDINHGMPSVLEIRTSQKIAGLYRLFETIYQNFSEFLTPEMLASHKLVPSSRLTGFARSLRTRKQNLLGKVDEDLLQDIEEVANQIDTLCSTHLDHFRGSAIVDYKNASFQAAIKAFLEGERFLNTFIKIQKLR